MIFLAQSIPASTFAVQNFTHQYPFVPHNTGDAGQEIQEKHKTGNETS